MVPTPQEDAGVATTGLGEGGLILIVTELETAPDKPLQVIVFV
jgi:hypothetical protein